MGQKVNPIGIRLGIIREWNAAWYADGTTFAEYLNKDLKVRKLIRSRLSGASVSDVYIKRHANNAIVTIHTARPGLVIGRKGADIDRLRADISMIIGKAVNVNIEEVRKPELEAYLVAEGICSQLERRVMFRRAMKRAISNAMRIGAKGIKIAVSGRLNGADIARTEWYREGRVPLHTLRADISYGFCEADTTYGKLGVKVWIFRGEVLNDFKEINNTPANSRTRKVNK